MEIEFLSAAVPLSKTVSVSGVHPYPMVRRFTSLHEACPTLQSFYNALQAHSQLGHCLLKGRLDKPLTNESRATHTHPDTPTDWVCLDFDGFPAATVAEALRLLSITCACIVQLSASAALKPGLRAHVFFRLSSFVQPTLLKAWLKHLNFTHDLPQRLSASGVALLYPLDVTTCQNDKLIYIAPPKFTDVPDPLAGTPRLSYIEGDETFTLPQFPLDVAARELDRINRLRQALGLRKKSVMRFLDYQGTQVLPNPEVAVVTDVVKARGFTYLNLNGGDSLGYYFPDNNPTVLYNFKGEPNYKLSEICPDFSPEPVTEPVPVSTDDQEIIFPCVDITTGQYIFVHYSQGTLNYFPVKDRIRLNDLCLQYGVSFPIFIPHWEFYYDPSTFFNSDSPIDSEHKRINIYVPSPYLAEVRHPKTLPLTGSHKPILQLIRHVLCGCEESLDYFLNWLAYIWQTGKKPKTAWVLHGRTGTGKGLLFKVLTKLFRENARPIGPEVLSDKFNVYLSNTQLMLVDEFDAQIILKNDLEARLRNWITEDFIDIRAMRTSSAKTTSYIGFIFSSNQHDSTALTTDDRRYHIPPRQEFPLSPSDQDVEDYLDEDNLRAFSQLLYLWMVDEAKVRNPMRSAAREVVKDASTNSPEELVAAFNQGNFSYFIGLIPALSDVTEVSVELTAYRTLIMQIYSQLIEYPLGTTVPIGITRDEIRTVFRYLLGWHQSPSKFKKALARFGMEFTVQRVERNGYRYIGRHFDFALKEDDVHLYKTAFRDQKDSSSFQKTLTLKVVK